MAWTYAGTPETVPRDEVRLLVGDTDTNDQLLTDAEIAYFLAQGGNNARLAGSKAAGAIAARYSRKADRSIGDLRMSFSQQAKAYRELAADLLSQYKRGLVGSISIPTISAVRDSIDFPDRMRHGEAALQEWRDADDTDEDDYGSSI